MAKEKIVIAELDIDVKGLIKAASESKNAISSLKEELNKCRQTGTEFSTEYKRLEDEIKSVTAAYEAQKAAINIQVNVTQALIAQQQNFTAIQQNTVIATQLVTEAVATQAKTFNDYKQQVADSFNQINIFNGGLGGFISRAQEAGGTGKLFKSAFDGMATGIKGMGAAISANPAGIIIMALVKAGEALFNAFKNFTPVAEKAEQVMAGVGAAFEAVKNTVIGLFNSTASLGDLFFGLGGSMAKAAGNAIDLKKAQQDLTKQMELQEVKNEDAKKSIDEFTRTSQDATLSEKQRLEALAGAAKLEKKNYDERKAIAQGLYDNATKAIETGKNLTKDEITQLKDKGFEYAQELAKRKAITADELETLKKAHIERTKVYAEEAGLSRKQAEDEKKLRAEVQAQKDAEAEKEKQRRQKLADDALTKQKQLLVLYAAQGDASAKTLNERIAFEEEISKKSLAILAKELKLKKISLEEFKVQEFAINREKYQNITALNTEYSRVALDIYMEQHKTLLKSGEQVTKDLVEQENKRLKQIFDEHVNHLLAGKDFTKEEILRNKDRINTLTLDQQKFYAEYLKLKSAFEETKAANDQALKAGTDEQEKTDKQKKRDDEAAQSALDYEVKIAQSSTRYEADMLLEQQRYDEQLAKLKQREEDGLISHKQFLIFKDELDKESAKNKEKLALQNMQVQLGAMQSVATALGEAFGQSKELALAQATMNAGQAILSIWSGVITGNPLVDSITKGVLTAATTVKTARQIKDIQSAKKPKQPKFEQGGLLGVGGNRHSAGGTLFTGQDGTRFEAERGELIGVMNRNAARHFMAFNNAFPAGGGNTPNYFAGGGIVSREIASQGINLDELAGKIAQANSTLPAPIVAVQDIITQGDSYIKVRDAANF